MPHHHQPAERRAANRQRHRIHQIRRIVMEMIAMRDHRRHRNCDRHHRPYRKQIQHHRNHRIRDRYNRMVVKNDI